MLIMLVFSTARCMLPAAFCVSRCGCSRPYVFILSNKPGWSEPLFITLKPRAFVAELPYQLSPCAPGWLMFKQSKGPKHLRGPTCTSLTFPWLEVMTGARAADKCHVKAPAKELIKASRPQSICLVLWSVKQSVRSLFQPHGGKKKDGYQTDVRLNHREERTYFQSVFNVSLQLIDLSILTNAS